MKTLRALALLTVTLAVRLLREPQIVRSLTFPTLLIVGTMAATMLVVTSINGAAVVAVPDANPGLAAAVQQAGFTVVAADPADAMAAGQVWAGTDGRTIWLGSPRNDDLVLERAVREHVGANWRPKLQKQAVPPATSASMTGMLLKMMAGPFLLYGVVFGAGMVARDRDDGTLESELALALPWWVHGASRLIASASLLTAGYGVGVLICHAYLGSDGVFGYLAHGAAAFATATAIGLGLIGRGGIRSGFTGPLAAGITAVTALVGLGLSTPTVGVRVPIASLVAFSPVTDGWIAPLTLSALVCVAASAMFSARQRS